MRDNVLAGGDETKISKVAPGKMLISRDKSSCNFNRTLCTTIVITAVKRMAGNNIFNETSFNTSQQSRVGVLLQHVQAHFSMAGILLEVNFSIVHCQFIGWMIYKISPKVKKNV